MEKGTKFIVFIDYCEPDMAPNSPGFDSQPRFYHAETMEQARKRIKTEYEKGIAYAKEIGIDTEEEDIFDAYGIEGSRATSYSVTD
jgi:hypothetical protein